MGTLLFVFVVLVLLSLYGLPLLPTIIDERRIMKLETSERLYMESAHILSTLLVTVPLSLLAAVMEVLIICVFSGLPTEYWPTIFFWACLLFLVFDAVFQLCAAVAPDAEQALGLALPFLIVFMLFNGLVVSPATAFLRWIFEISPTNFALQAIVLRIGEDANPIGKAIIESLGYAGGKNTQGAAVMVGALVLLRGLQVLALKFLNKIQK